jgi:hypothetical protein
MQLDKLILSTGKKKHEGTLRKRRMENVRAEEDKEIQRNGGLMLSYFSGF